MIGLARKPSRLHVDLETYSSVNLLKTGVYPYVESDDFEIMLFQYKLFYEDTGYTRTEVIDLMNGESIPSEVLAWLLDPDVQKIAYNAGFERQCLRVHMDRPMPPEQWQCTLVLASTLGFPGNLGDASRVMGLPEDRQKMGIGRGLIHYFCKPCKPTKANDRRTRNYPHHNPEKWALFKEYGARDVDAESEIYRRAAKFPLTAFEQRLWQIDQHINDRGVKIDIELAKQAVAIDAAYKAELTAEAIALTGVENPKSVKQLLAWLNEELEDDIVAAGDEEILKLTKKTIPIIVSMYDNTVVHRVLAIRLELAKSSVTKYAAMLRGVCKDGRVRGLFQFYGANRTGRWAGRLVQVQNLPGNKMLTLELARRLVKSGAGKTLQLLYPSMPQVLSELIRTAFIPEGVDEFAVVDFSAIEARVLAWLANETWRLEVFATHGQIYEASAAAMFNIPWADFQAYIDRKQKHPMRQKGKVAELALGYQGGAGALVTMGALEGKDALKMEDLDPIKVAWREANPNIVDFWYKLQRAAIAAVREPGRGVDVAIGAPGCGAKVTFRVERDILFLTLPSGRNLCYIRPRLSQDDYGWKVSYEGPNQKTKRWEEVDAYGGKWAENLCQAIARDCLAWALVRLWDLHNERSCVMHVHDEGVFESNALKLIEQVFGRSIKWAPGLLLRGDGYMTKFYKKDD